MEITFSQHALTKMRQRRISNDFVVIAVEKPDFVRYGKLGRKESYKKFNKLHLKVVTISDGTIIVVTTYWVGKVA